jgi:uncharacterized Zn finger protein
MGDKVEYECPYCGNKQTESHNKDETTCTCEKCGKYYNKLWKQDKRR